MQLQWGCRIFVRFVKIPGGFFATTRHTMTEGNPKPSEPIIENAGPAPEMPLREVHKLPSQVILDGIHAGRIRHPEALRGYFLRRRTEFLQAHPDREGELDGPGEFGRGHRLVYSDT